MILFLAYLSKYMTNFSIFLQISIVIFNLIIFIVSLKKDELKNNLDNLDKIEDILH